MNKDYDKCVTQMALESEMAKNINLDTLKMGLVQFRTLIERNFGNQKFEYSLMKAEKNGQQLKAKKHLQTQHLL